MRDIILTLLVGALVPLVFWHPVIGAYLWAWLSLMNPQKMTYGFAFSMPFAQAAAAATLLMVLVTRKKQFVPMNSITTLLLVMLLWMTITGFFAIAPTEDVIDRWVHVMKIQLMFFVTLMLVTNPNQMRLLIWVVVLSVGYFGIKGGLWTLMTGGGGRVWGPPGGMLQGNNELAVGLVILMPMFYFLHATETRVWLRRALVVCMVLITFSILGSQSRGALLALLAMAFFLGLKSKYPIRTSVGLGLLVLLAVAFMPDTWSDRMDTIRTFEQDTSAMSRIWTWTTLWNAALDRPLVGVGFKADNPIVFERYAPLDGAFAIFAGHFWVAHSIYFQMLGEHGFVGLALFLSVGVATWLKASALSKATRNDPQFASWVPILMRMCQVSIMGYAVGGAFLSLAYLDLPYYIIGFVVLTDLYVRKRLTMTVGVAKVPAADPASDRRDGIAAPEFPQRGVR
jgi:probable O-glycosylation ligase (exosortase A-associated)